MNSDKCTPDSNRALIIENVMGKVPSSMKFRRMLCLSFLFCGSCTYRQCVFIHDHRLMYEKKLNQTKNYVKKAVKNANLKPSKSADIETCNNNSRDHDAFFWPLLGSDLLQIDPKGVPAVVQDYQIPESFKVFDKGTCHNRSLFSMWNYLLEFFFNNHRQEVDFPGNMSIFEPSEKIEINKFLGIKRLKVFIDLSNGKIMFNPTQFNT